MEEILTLETGLPMLWILGNSEYQRA